MNSHNQIEMQHNELKIIKIELENGSEILIWNVGYELDSVKIRVQDKNTKEVQNINIKSKIKQVKIFDDQKMTVTHESKK